MVRLLPALLLFPLLVLTAASKKSAGSAKGENEDLILTVTIHTDPADVKEMIGSDLDGHYIVAEIKVDPKYGKTVTVDRDDFQLRSDKDGEKAKPFTASQIAGSEALVLSGDGGDVKKSRGWSLGGIGMGGGMGAGSGEGNKGPTKATMKGDDKENPLKKVLDAKSLPEKKTDQSVEGLMYFPMEKQKLKDLELHYGGRENRISLRFKPVQ
jgi:hypothetical protein